MPVTVSQMADAMRRRRASGQARAELRARHLRAVTPAAATLLRERYGATRVWLFGSLAGTHVRESSDVDLAVEGMAGSCYFAALTDLMTLFGAPVDLVRLEEASPSLVERVLAEGSPL